MTTLLPLLAIGATLFTGPAYAGFSPSATNGIALYWGQDSKNDGSQQSLATYCANSDVSIIPMAFLDSFYGTGNQPVLNFANSQNACSTFSGTALINCPNIG
jgi:chitinase